VPAAQTLSAAAAKAKQAQYVFTYSNPNRALGERSLIAAAAEAHSSMRPHSNGQPAAGDDDFFLGDSA